MRCQFTFGDGRQCQGEVGHGENHGWIAGVEQQARKEFDAAAIRLANDHYKGDTPGRDRYKDMLSIRASGIILGLLPPACTCDRTGWPGSASPELHEVNCPARKDGEENV